MEGRYKFYLDGTLFDNPDNWEEWTSELWRDHAIRGILSMEDGDLTFSGDAYRFLIGKRNEGYCQSVSVIIKENCGTPLEYVTAFEGLIFVSDIEFDITACLATCELVDNSYESRINNNKQIEVSVGAGKSKNGEDITIPDLYFITMFNPCDAATLTTPQPRAYRFFQVAKYLIDFVSDGFVGFRSTILDIGGEFEASMLTSGLLIRDPSNADKSVTLTFEDFLRNISRLCNLSFRIDVTATGPVFVLEKTSDTFVNSTLFNLDNIDRIIRALDQARNYAAVELGTSDVIDSLGCGALGGAELAFPDQIDLFGCKREQFAVTGTCNIDTVLDLTVDWVISSNVIESIHINGDQSYDDKVCVIDCENLGVVFGLPVASAILGDVYGNGSPPYFYNARFFNKEVVSRHFGAIPGSLVKYLAAPNTGFKAKNNTLETLQVPVAVANAWPDGRKTWDPYPFGDDFSGPDYYDLNNDYGNGTIAGNTVAQADARYTAPSNNIYKFQINMYLYNGNTPPVPGPFLFNDTAWAHFDRYDSSNVLIATYTVANTIPNGGYTYAGFVSPMIYMAAGDYIKPRFTVSHDVVVANILGLSLGFPCTFELLSTGTQGGVFEIFNPEDYLADQYKFKVPMTMYQWKQLKANPTLKITFNDGTNFAAGWVESIKYSYHKAMAEFVLVTNS